jgi:ribosome-associated toxin RatA of RatAB toxin-antitoxin module
MRAISRSAIVPYTPAAMFDLVADIAAYPVFLAWCEAVSIKESSAQRVVADLTFGLAGLRSTFTTANELDRPGSMTMSLVDGPFSCLDGRWSFEPLGDSGCKISLHVEFEFNSSTHDLLFGRVFESACNDMIDAFTRRARSVYDSDRSNLR